MNQHVLIYVIKTFGNLGCFPECLVVNTEASGRLALNFVKLSAKNKAKYNKLFDEQDEIMLKACFQLEKESILAKISDKEVCSWDELLNNYLTGQVRSIKAQGVKDYLVDYINGFQNDFFNNSFGKRLYLSKGKYISMWQKVTIEEELPDLFYCFDNQESELLYYPKLSCHNKILDLRNSSLLSRKVARILIDNKIYEFDNDVDGAKLIPFFTKENVSVKKQNLTEYVQKVILPLVPTNRVIPIGFDIQPISKISQTILKVKELNSVQQMSLFANDKATKEEKSLLFELLFEYDDFCFSAGRDGKTNRLDILADSFTILQVSRDKDIEQIYINKLNSVGIDLSAKTRKILYVEGIEWLSEHHLEIESAGIEIRFDNKQNANQSIFLGERKISVELVEERDWFDIKGKVKFGEFEVPFLVVLNYIKQNKQHILLPNGELAQIPQAWFDEYKTLADLCEIAHGKAVVPKHYCAVAGNLEPSENLKLSIKENVRHLLNNNLDINYEVPVNFKATLRNYQKQGYNWLRILDDCGLGGCLADDMGLGKTVQTLCLLQYLKDTNRRINLLIVPTSLIYNWKQESAKFCTKLRMYAHVGSQRTKHLNYLENVDVIITSYAVLRRDKHLFEKMHFEYVILDEAQSIKNPQSDITRVCLSLSAKRFLTLTGTPLENSLTDIWSLAHFFNRGMLGSLNNYTKACKKEQNVELYRRLLKPLILRRRKEDVLKDLPDKTIIVHECEMTEEQQLFYRELRNSYRDKFLEAKDSDGRVNSMILLEGLLRLRQAANHPKLADKDYVGDSGKFETVCQKLEDVITQGHKLLLFSSFTEHLKLYKKYLDDLKIQYCYLDGSTKDRQEQVEKFQKDSDCKVFLLSLKAGGVGLNLTAASYVFLTDPWWNPAAEAQAFDRAHRIGQDKNVFVYKFITQNSIEEKILKLQEEKLKLFDLIVNSETEIIKQLDLNDILKLIE
jgi:SNF2 family DNA or RNA helicase